MIHIVRKSTLHTSPINTKLGDLVNLGKLFLTMWINRVLKSKTKELLKVLSSSGIRGTKFIPVYNFPAQ